MREFDESIRNLGLTYEQRSKFLKTVFENTVVNYVVEPLSEQTAKLIFIIDGNSPVEFFPQELIAAPEKENIFFYRLFQGDTNLIDKSSPELLFPGRRLVSGNAVGKVDVWTILAFGREKIEPAPLTYEYIVKTSENGKLSFNREIKVRNKVTGTRFSITPTENIDLDAISNSDSLHPWTLSKTKKPGESIRLSGEITIGSDRIFEANQSVHIKSGTTFKIAKNASLIFYGKVNAEGTASQPIIFTRAKTDEPWGSIVIQGQSASGSSLSHIIVEGGSITSQNLINYPGQLNIHDVSNFNLKKLHH